ncbi:MAG: cytochrome c biogenesis protein ResB, partial [Rikenellaceae bacterium]
MIKKLAFYLYLIITVVLASATVIEKIEGTDFVHLAIYGAWWFYALWGVMTAFAIVHIVRSKLYRSASTFMLHCSFILMLLGAITTALTAESGAIYLERDITKKSYTNERNEEVELPFSITLTDFEVKYYSGTRSAADYISFLEFEDTEGAKTQVEVSMNKIATYKGYRFYQSH